MLDILYYNEIKLERPVAHSLWSIIYPSTTGKLICVIVRGAVWNPLFVSEMYVSFYTTLGPSWILNLNPCSPGYFVLCTTWTLTLVFHTVCILNDYIFSTCNQNLGWGSVRSDFKWFFAGTVGGDGAMLWGFCAALKFVGFIFFFFIKPTKHHERLLSVCMTLWEWWRTNCESLYYVFFFSIFLIIWFWSS